MVFLMDCDKKWVNLISLQIFSVWRQRRLIQYRVATKPKSLIESGLVALADDQRFMITFDYIHYHDFDLEFATYFLKAVKIA